MAERTDPRAVALALLDRVTAGGALLAQALPDLTAALPPAQAARAGRLAVTALRQAGRADRMLGPHLRQRPPETVLNLFRLALAELAEGEAPHGVVNAAVGLARSEPETRRMAGLVNAVLRKLAPQVPPGWEGAAPSPLPKALRKRLVAAWGKEAVAIMEAVQAQSPPTDLTPRDGDAAALAAATGGTALPTGSVRLTGPMQVSALPGYQEGRFWVQDAAAALPARILAARPGEQVLDLCAAPGGKTMQLAAAGAEVTALDISAERMARVAENLARTGLTAHLVISDALDFTEGGFDAILLDAPCSATGTIRRHPDLPFAKAALDIAPLVALQTRLLAHAADLLAPGGRLVFCTCSLLSEEGETLPVPAILTPDSEALDLPGIEPGWRTGASGLRLRPDLWADRGGIDGFFISAWHRTG